MSNSLAVIGKVVTTNSIPGADFIKQATVVCGSAGKWSGVVGQDIHAGDLVTVFLQDAVLPENEAWEFMRRHKWRVRMCRFKGCPSECVILPFVVDEDCQAPDIGTDLTELLGVTKYTKALPANMTGIAKGDFPYFIPKTDEPNFQTVTGVQDLISSQAMVARVKYDGTSCTAFNDEVTGHLRVCSRNLELEEFSPTGGSNSYWLTARKYHLENLPFGCALQFEIIGPGIQGNPLGLAATEGRAFTLYDFKNHRKCSDLELEAAALTVGMEIAHPAFRLDAGCYLDDDQLRTMAEIKYPNGRHGKGLVFRSLDHSVSFKVLSLLYKDRD